MTIYRPIAGDHTDQVTDQVNDLVKRLVFALTHDMSRQELMDKLELRHRPYFIANYLQPAIDHGCIDYLYPDSKSSPKQKYRMTEKGKITTFVIENR